MHRTPHILRRRMALWQHFALALGLLLALPAGARAEDYCQAAFLFAPNPSDAQILVFSSTASGAPNIAYLWSFGDGSSASGPQVQHSYALAGTYTVCHTIYDGTGCSDMACETIEVGNSIACGLDFSIQLDIFDGIISASLVDEAMGSIILPDQTTWYLAESGDELGESAFLYAPWPYNTPATLCVEYSIAVGGGLCEGTVCMLVQSSGPGACVDPDNIDFDVTCLETYAPVCGCDGITYPNYCIAQNYFGLSAWTPGPCEGSAGDTLACQAAFMAMPLSLDGVLQESAFFASTSNAGPGSILIWDMGDGSILLNTDTFYHTFPEAGIYSVCLTLIDSLAECVSTFCGPVLVGDIDSTCYLTDCVFPGDANGNGEANVYDILPIGMQYGSAGPARPNASLDWFGQAAPNWSTYNFENVNDKHTDTNGDGIVDAYDIEAIIYNYDNAHDGIEPLSVQSGVPVFIVFDSTSVDINADDSLVDVTAGIYIGSPNLQVTDFYGMAFTLAYDAELVADGSVQLFYNGNSFFGPSDQMLSIVQDHPDEGLLDIGLVRKDGIGTDGHGRVATVQFTIIGDIVEGRSDEEVPFAAEPMAIQGINANGGTLVFTRQGGEMLLVDQSQNNTASLPQLPESRISLAPNPSTGLSWLDLGTLRQASVQVRNVLGQIVFQAEAPAQVLPIRTADWPQGVYIVEVRSPEGRVTAKLVVE